MATDQRHLKCSTCSTIPDRSEAFWKGGGLLSERLQKSEAKLIIVGAPFYNDRTSTSQSCLKQCPKCSTYYDWDFTYEFLVNGSEDDIVLTRLSDEEGKKREKRILTTIEQAEKKFIVEAKSRVEALSASKDGKGVYGAATFLQGGQVRGHAITFAIPALVKAMVMVSVDNGENSYFNSCASLIYFVLSPEIKGSTHVARKVQYLLKDEQIDLVNPRTKQLRWLIDDIRETLQSLGRVKRK